MREKYLSVVPGKSYQGEGFRWERAGIIYLYKYPEMHGGSIPIEAVGGSDSLFSFPYSITFAEQVEAFRKSFLNPNKVTMIHVMVVEDDAAIQEAMSLIFEPPDFHLTSCTNGQPIVDDDYIRPDIFLIDKLLPGIDGLDICQMLKSQEDTKNIPVIILSASPHVESLARLAGADGFVEKPFHLKVLRHIVDKALRERKIN